MTLSLHVLQVGCIVCSYIICARRNTMSYESILNSLFRAVLMTILNAKMVALLEEGLIQRKTSV